MIDTDTIDDFEDFDGDTLWAYGYNTVTKQWVWSAVPIEDIYEGGRTDILRCLGLME